MTASLQLAAIVYEHPNEAIRKAIQIASHTQTKLKIDDIADLVGAAAAELPSLPISEELATPVCFHSFSHSDSLLTYSYPLS